MYNFHYAKNEMWLWLQIFKVKDPSVVFFSIFFVLSQSNYVGNILKSLLLLEMKFDIEIPNFKVKNVSRNFKTIFYVFETSNFA